MTSLYRVNDKALNNGKQTIYSKSITILSAEFQEVTLNDILENAGKAQGHRVYVRHDIISIDTSKPPEGIIRIIGEDVFVETENYNYHLNPKLDYSAISDTNKIAEIEKSVANTTYVTSSETVAKGEWTVVFAKPNHGKTLITLATITQQIANGLIKGEDVFYFNLDDAKSGYLEKLKILKRFDVNVFDVDPAAIMTHLIDNQQAKDKVIIIDTLILSHYLNNFKNIIPFSELFKRFCKLGGTVITLVHAKKYVDKDGVPILERVELQSNAHCVYYLKRFEDIIKMINIKSRTKVKAEVTFQVGVGLPYPDQFRSVRTLTDKQETELFNGIKQAQLAIDHEGIDIDTIVESIKETIFNEIHPKTDLVEEVYNNTGNYKRTIFSVLNEYEGILWKMLRGPYNSKEYYII